MRLAWVRLNDSAQQATKRGNSELSVNARTGGQATVSEESGRGLAAVAIRENTIRANEQR